VSAQTAYTVGILLYRKTLARWSTLVSLTPLLLAHVIRMQGAVEPGLCQQLLTPVPKEHHTRYWTPAHFTANLRQHHGIHHERHGLILIGPLSHVDGQSLWPDLTRFVIQQPACSSTHVENGEPHEVRLIHFDTPMYLLERTSESSESGQVVTCGPGWSQQDHAESRIQVVLDPSAERLKLEVGFVPGVHV
jgi:hypothetical protein